MNTKINSLSLLKYELNMNFHQTKFMKIFITESFLATRTSKSA